MTPNVVVILADDLGFSDLGSYGGEIETPNLDRLAAEGVRMSAFYATPRCSPSRASLLTGRHPHSVGIGILTSDDRPNGYPGSLDPAAPTIAELVRSRGYRTALAGKWHLSSDVTTPNETWPTRRGFEEFTGILEGASSYYRPPLRRGDDLVDPEELAADEEFYLTDGLSRAAVDFVERAADAGEPFLLYLAYTAPHWPLHAPDADIARHRERYRAGWDELRARRLERLERDGVLAPGTTAAHDPEVPAWEDAGDPEWEAERMATYAAQVAIMDRGIGDLLDVLERRGLRDDTLIVFTSDNGACAEELPFASGPPAARVCPPTTRDGRPVRVGNEPTVIPGPETGYASYGRSWAHLSNAPFRLYKRWVHEGGIAAPLVASWPAGGLAAGAIAHAPAHIVDLVPTILAAIGGDLESAAGASLLPEWRRPTARGDVADDRALCWEHMGNAAVRRGRWKLVREALRPWELYDLDADRGETTDVADRHPELVADLAREWDEWASANGVLPWEDVLADFRARGRPVPGDA